MTEYHDRIRKSIEAGEEADYQQDCLNLLAEISKLQDAFKKIIETINIHEDKKLALFQVREIAREAIGKQGGGE